jgi:hypothetical protein
MRALRPVLGLLRIDIQLVPPPSLRTPPLIAALVFAFSHAARNFAIASSRVAAVPLVTPGAAGQIEVIDQNQRNSGGVPEEPSS